VPRWVEVVRRPLFRPQRCRHRFSHNLRLRFPRRHPRRRRRHRLRGLHRPHLLCGHAHAQSLSRHLPQLDLLIRTTAPWGSTLLGTEPSSSGAAGSTTSVASQRHRQHQQTHTTARTASPTGRRAGVSRRKNGVVEFMGRAARTRVVGVRHLLTHTIVMPDLPIGWQAGACPRRRGAAQTRGRAAHQQLEDVLERVLDGCS